jgi:hypothetical protein
MSRIRPPDPVSPSEIRAKLHTWQSACEILHHLSLSTTLCLGKDVYLRFGNTLTPGDSREGS